MTLLLFAGAPPLHAGPWLPAGDRQVREDVELLTAAGFIQGPLGSWPLPWMQVAPGLALARQGAPAPHILAAVRRLERLSARDLQSTRVEARVQATTDPDLLRDFEDTARETVDAGFRYEFDSGRLTLSLGGGYRDGQDGRDFHAENSYAAYAAGNWALYAGYVQHWWGPGQDSALLFSNNARPIPQIGIKRLQPTPIDLPVLRWLGPFKFDAFAGILTEKRESTGYDNPAVVGFRASFEPADGFEIGLNRALQLCGRNRPCGAGTVFDALFPFGDAENTGTLDEPGNQLGGFDLTYRFMAGNVAASTYMEWEAEDEAGIFLLDRFVRMYGATAAGALGEQGASWTANVEYTNTLLKGFFDANSFLNPITFPGSAYNNSIYREGFTYRNDILGASIGGDSELITLQGSITDTSNRRYYAAYRRAELNSPDRIGNMALSRNRERVNMLTTGAVIPTSFGDLSGELRLQDDRPNTPDRSSARISAEIGWRTRF
ncbi:capsule assembly Wzi family protein [Pacificimonas sp. ICDLI1SI03]